MRIASAEVLADKLGDFDTLRSQLPAHYNLALLDDSVAGPILKFYLMLTEMPHLIADLCLAPTEIFWSRYYWFLRYTKLREAVAGRDVGLEQQALQILEYPYPPCSPDWSELEQVESMAERDARSQLQSENGVST